MATHSLTRNQLAVVQRPLDSRLFLHGPAGTGKSTAGAERLKFLLSSSVPGDSILVLTSQRILQEPYVAVINSPDTPPGGDATPMTMSGLAWRACNLFWPLASRAAGFGHPDNPPVFLTLETAQYYMAYVIRPLLGQGYFESVTLDRNRVYSQILDNLNKSASVGFSYTEIGARLDAAWSGDPAQRNIYADVQDCATRFRHFCLQHNLLDFSLLLEVFTSHLWPDPTVRDYLLKTYRHLLYDNVEEDVPRSHDVVREWLPELDSALLIFDEGGGYRTFLGADSQTGSALSQLCDEQLSFDESFVMSDDVSRLADSLASPASPVSESPLPLDILLAHFVPEMADDVVEQIRTLIADQGVPPSEIV